MFTSCSDWPGVQRWEISRSIFLFFMQLLQLLLFTVQVSATVRMPLWKDWKCASFSSFECLLFLAPLCDTRFYHCTIESSHVEPGANAFAFRCILVALGYRIKVKFIQEVFSGGNKSQKCSNSPICFLPVGIRVNNKLRIITKYVVHAVYYSM